MKFLRDIIVKKSNPAEAEEEQHVASEYDEYDEHAEFHDADDDDFEHDGAFLNDDWIERLNESTGAEKEEPADLGEHIRSVAKSVAIDAEAIDVPDELPEEEPEVDPADAEFEDEFEPDNEQEIVAKIWDMVDEDEEDFEEPEAEPEPEVSPQELAREAMSSMIAPPPLPPKPQQPEAPEQQQQAQAPAPAEPAAPAPAEPAVAPPVEPASRAGRAKTRMLGFHNADAGGPNVFELVESKNELASNKFPVGWMVVVEGPGRGTAFTLQHGVSTIGRGADQTIKLDFGDNSISRENHAAIAFDEELKAFFIGHGGKSNLVRLNGRPVLSTEELSSGDSVRIGETTVRFVGFCDEEFDWNLSDDEENVRANAG